MEETKKVQVAPSKEDEVTKFYLDFGWSLVSSQEINNTDSHLERKGDTIYNVTTKESYVNLLFKRDTNMQNYKQILECEQKYDAVPQNRATSIVGRMILICAAIFFMIMMISGFSDGNTGFAVPCLILFLGLSAGAFFATRSGMKSNAEIRKQNEENDRLRAELRSKSRSLL